MRRLALLFAATAVSLSLAGCSLIPGLGSQSGVQACAAVSDAVSKSMTNFADALSSASSDPDAAGKALDQLVADFNAARGKVSNADVGAAMDNSIAAVKKMSDLLKAGGAEAMNQDEFSTAAEDAQKAFTDLATACTKF